MDGSNTHINPQHSHSELTTACFQYHIKTNNYIYVPILSLQIYRILRYKSLAGWRPRRTIIFCAWDAEESGIIGSSEWMEVGW